MKRMQISILINAVEVGASLEQSWEDEFKPVLFIHFSGANPEVREGFNFGTTRAEKVVNI